MEVTTFLASLTEHERKDPCVLSAVKMSSAMHLHTIMIMQCQVTTNMVTLNYDVGYELEEI